MISNNYLKVLNKVISSKITYVRKLSKRASKYHAMASAGPEWLEVYAPKLYKLQDAITREMSILNELECQRDDFLKRRSA